MEHLAQRAVVGACHHTMVRCELLYEAMYCIQISDGAWSLHNTRGCVRDHVGTAGAAGCQEGTVLYVLHMRCSQKS